MAKKKCTGADLRRIALSLEGVTEAPHFDRAAFKVARIFVTLAPEAFSPVAGGWGRMGYTTGLLAKLSEAELREALEAAHRSAGLISKKAVAKKK